MNTKNIGFLGSAALALTLLVRPASGAAEVFSASLLGDNEVPPINSTGAAAFHMENNNAALEPVDERSSYANIDTTNFSGGEIRGQVRRGNEHSDNGSGNYGDSHGHEYGPVSE